MPYTFVTGGVRSGKSGFAERLAGLERRVLYVATGMVYDEEMEQRIQLHRDRRPAQWGLLEVRDGLSHTLEKALGWDVILIDDLSTWVSNVLLALPESEWRSSQTRAHVLEEAQRLSLLLEETHHEAIVVTNETGLGGVAMTPLGRAFQDLLGEVNQIMAARAREMYLVVSGRALKI